MLGYTLVAIIIVIVKADVTSVNNIQNILLDLHNSLRSNNGVNVPLTLDPYLQYLSGNWSQHLYNTNTFVHRGDHLVGENIAYRIDNNLKTEADFAIALFDQWKDELQYFHNYLFPNTSQPATADTSHISQILWSQTTKLGCGLSGNFPKFVLVCNYWSPGNIIGHRTF